ncbi:MAG: AAA family ATPase [Kofleriaceae bacterium]
MIVLSAESERELADALAQAFTPEDLDRKVADPLGVPAAERSGARDVRERAAALVRWASGSDRVEALLSAALRGNPSSPRLRRLNEAVGLLPATSALAEVLREVLPPGGERAWLRGLAEAQRRVCRIHAVSGDEGTGFLVGPDQVMTHAAVLGAADPAAITRAQVEVAFEDAALGLDRARPVVIAIGELVVLRLERAAGREAALPAAEVAVRSRGWIAPPVADPVAGSPLVVVQFHRGAPVVTADPHGHRGREGRAIRHRTATRSGSTGAPCFDEQWRLVGMHAGGDGPGHHAGMAASAIVEELRAAGFGWDASSGVSPEARREPEGSGALDEAVRGIASAVGATDDAWSVEVEDLELPLDERWAWAEAAATHASFDPEALAPWGVASPASRVALLLESSQTRGPRWVISERLRAAALRRLADRGELSVARAANPTDASDPLDVLLGELIEGRASRLGEPRDPAGLRRQLTAVEWLHGIVAPRPDLAVLRAALERAMLLEPFRHLTRGFFAGREPELARLAGYANGAGGPPVFIHGPGGMGKSALLARFVLAHADHDPMDPARWRPFVYLDFDRAELDATDRVGVVLAIVRQLGPQLPELAERAHQLVERWSRRARGPAEPLHRRPPSSPDPLAQVLDDVAALLGALAAPTALVLDTLEEVQFVSPDAIGPLIELVTELRRRIPRLRPILAGRVEVTEGVAPMELGPLAPAAAEALLDNELPPAVVARPDLVTKLLEIVGRNPLSLQLAAQLLRREAGDPAAVIEELGEQLRHRVCDAIVQGRLYERILGHIHDGRVAALAYPGLVLRRITWVLIRDVLARPCGLGELDEPAARELFGALAREVALVRQGRDAGELELRPELRRIVREDFANDPRSAARRAAIHAAAVEHYARRATLADRAEEIYHRLALDQDPEEVDRRWLAGIEPLLRDAVAELPPRGASYLANRVGGLVDEARISRAGPLDWEAWVHRRAEDLISFGWPAKALALLASRAERLPASRLHYVESVARRMLPDPDLAGAEVAAQRAVAAAHASANTGELRDALEEVVQVRRLRGDPAGVLRALAELGDLGDALGDDLVLLQSEVEALEVPPAPEVDRAQFTQRAVRVFGRLSDELVAKSPELSRRVAAQVGAEDPATLRRVIRVVGTGALDDEAASGLRGVLAEWERANPEIGALVPAAGTSPREVASAARYLLDHRTLDEATAALFAGWLGSVVVPRRGAGRPGARTGSALKRRAVQELLDTGRFAPHLAAGADHEVPDVPLDREWLAEIQERRQWLAASPETELPLYQELYRDRRLTEQDVDGVLETMEQVVARPEALYDALQGPPALGALAGIDRCVWKLAEQFPTRPVTAEQQAQVDALRARYPLGDAEINPNEHHLELCDPWWWRLIRDGAVETSQLWPRRLAPFIEHGPGRTFLYQCPERIEKVALLSDLGVGRYPSQCIANQLDARAYPYVFHLGELSGDPRLIDRLLGRSVLFRVPGSLDLYRGGVAYQTYLETELASQRVLQQGSYFCMRFPRHQVVGIDVDWNGPRRFQRQQSRDWLTEVLDTGRALALTTILLTNRAPFRYGAPSAAALHDDLRPWSDHGDLDLWFWGEDPYGALFDRDVDKAPFIGSCIGHGGFPGRTQAAGEPSYVSPTWVELAPRFPAETGLRPDLGNNGWVELTMLDSGGVELLYLDWLGDRRFWARYEHVQTQPMATHLGLVASKAFERGSLSRAASRSS